MPEDLTEAARRLRFINQMKQYTPTWTASTGIPESVYIAIMASESNFGSADSLFGIKGSGTAGSKAYDTHEVVNGQKVGTNANFAAYNNPNEAHDDFIRLISTEPRYRAAWQSYQQTGNWRALLQGINQAGYATDQSWGEKIAALASWTAGKTGEDLNAGFAAGAHNVGVVNPSITKPSLDLNKPLDINDFYRQDEQGAWYLDQDELEIASNAQKAQRDVRAADREYQLGPLSQMVDDIITQIGSQISAGTLGVNKANSIFRNELDSYKMSLDAYEGQAFKYGTPAGAEYQRGFEPDSFAVKTLGLNSRANVGPTVDPLAEAMRLQDVSRTEFGKVEVPQVPSYSGQRASAYEDAGYNKAGVPQSPPAPANMPSEPLLGNTALQASLEASQSSPSDLLQAALARVREQRLLQQDVSSSARAQRD